MDTVYIVAAPVLSGLAMNSPFNLYYQIHMFTYDDLASYN